MQVFESHALDSMSTSLWLLGKALVATFSTAKVRTPSTLFLPLAQFRAALSADAVHSLTDLVSDFMTLATVSWALKPPTEKFPLGYGKIESLGSLGVSSLLVFGGVMMGWSAIVDLCHIYVPFVADFLEELHFIGHSHNHSHQIPNIQAAWLAGGSVLVKEWLYRASKSIQSSQMTGLMLIT
jgi:divalent metal cation (Fe/Co/Zn/Cd) transporter